MRTDVRKTSQPTKRRTKRTKLKNRHFAPFGMKFAYKFDHLCGTVYTKGNVVFTPDGNSLLSPVGNRITIFDLRNHTSKTFSFECRKDINAIAVSSDSRLLVVVDTDGRASVANLQRRLVLHRFHFKKPVRVIQFSPDNKYIAVSHDKQIHVWRSPGLHREFCPFVLHQTYTGHHDEVLSLSWSPDSLFLVSGSKDMTARTYSLHNYSSFKPSTLAGHRDSVLGVFFSQDSKKIYTIGKDSVLYQWEYEVILENNEMNPDYPELAQRLKWSSKLKFPFKQDYAKVRCVEFHRKSNLLVVGFSSGIFGLYELMERECNLIHTLSISQNAINTVAMNPSGDWIAFGSKKLGQLLVWEWQSETYVLKQQGHFFDLNTVAYSPDGQILATGSDDSKIKLWNTSSGFCYVTFKEHTGPITSLCFTGNGQALVSASLDGTVRAFDLNRYKNFRILTTPNPVQFTCLAVDKSGQIVCAGALDPFHIFVWSLQTGRLLDILSGHEGPLSSLAFSLSGTNTLLASASWDKTVRLWNVFQSKAFIEPLRHSSDVLSVAFRPDGNQICCATLDGNLSFWDPQEGELVASIEGSRDLSGGRKNNDRMTAQNNNASKYYTSVCYSADGKCILAGGNSKYVCIYETSQPTLLKKFQISHNRSLDGILDKLNSKNMTEAGPTSSILTDEEESDQETKEMNSLPGAKKGLDPGSRRKVLEIRSKDVKFSPTGQSWATASTEGLLVYSFDDNMTFDPFELDEDITPLTIRTTISKKKYSQAILMALHLNEDPYIREAVEAVPMENVSIVAQGLSDTYLQRMLQYMAKKLEESCHLEYYLRWSLELLQTNGAKLQENPALYQSTLRSIQKGIARQQTDLTKMCNENQFTLNYLCNLGIQKSLIELPSSTPV